MPDVITLGETMYLLSPLQGTIETAPLFTGHIGGAESNVAIGLARLGHSVRWISQLGADPFGQIVLKRLRGEGVDVSRAQMVEGQRTGVYFKEILGEDQFRVHYYREGSAASKMTPAMLRTEDFQGARYAFLTGITMAISTSAHDTVRTAIGMASQHGATVVFDANLRLKLWSIEEARRAILSVLPKVDYFLPGVDECRHLIGTSNPVEAAQHFIDLGAKHVIVKLGEEGALFKSADKEVFVAGVPVSKVVDPVGAGDGFAAGFLSGMLRGVSVEDAVAKGCAVGARVVSTAGDIEGLPTQQELDEFLGRRRRVER